MCKIPLYSMAQVLIVLLGLLEVTICDIGIGGADVDGRIL